MSQIKDLIERLKYYNEWRTGNPMMEMPKPSQITKDINLAIKLLERQEILEDIVESAANVAKYNDDLEGTLLLEEIFLNPIHKHYKKLI